MNMIGFVIFIFILVIAIATITIILETPKCTKCNKYMQRLDKDITGEIWYCPNCGNIIKIEKQ